MTTCTTLCRHISPHPGTRVVLHWAELSLFEFYVYFLAQLTRHSKAWKLNNSEVHATNHNLFFLEAPWHGSPSSFRVTYGLHASWAQDINPRLHHHHSSHFSLEPFSYLPWKSILHDRVSSSASVSHIRTLLATCSFNACSCIISFIAHLGLQAHVMVLHVAN
jgi:hypothetical protein